jgi:uncharacterized protein (DUF1697 family)
VADCVALLRAVNVGGRVVKMDRLRALFEEMKLANVETFIASGNVLFDSRANASALEARIEKHLEKSLGFQVATFVRSSQEMAVAASHEPFGDPATLPPAHGTYVGFLKDEPNAAARAKLLALRSDIDDLAVHGREVYWRAMKSLTETKLGGAVIEKILGPMTMRNVTTVKKLAEKM